MRRRAPSNAPLRHDEVDGVAGDRYLPGRGVVATAGPSGSISGGSLGLQTTSCSGSSCSTPFNDMMLTILIPLNSSYGTSLWNSGWWQVEYNVSSGNDTTTWQVQVRGKPVHLTMP